MVINLLNKYTRISIGKKKNGAKGREYCVLKEK
jgi:hypothetical protein